MSFKIGPYQFSSKLFLAPMAGITDRPYRDICRHYGAGLTVSEMITSDPSLLQSRKTQLRLLDRDEPEPRSIQIVGTDPEIMANAAITNQNNGANIIDINMGCPAKKVCNKAAGSALLRDTKRVTEILTAIVESVNIPVTLKIRTGWGNTNRNALKVANIAEDCGISSLTVHGRTRNQAYTGFAEYETIRQIKKAVTIPVIANGDILALKDIQFIFDYTAVDAVMLGRITQGQPWVFKELNEQLTGDFSSKPITANDKVVALLNHIGAIHRHYGTGQGVRIARKHIGWYLSNLIKHDQNLLKAFKKEVFVITDSEKQYDLLESKLNDLIEQKWIK